MTDINTKLLCVYPVEKHPTEIDEAGRLLAVGELVAIPTETVYGLGANALDPKAVKDIFRAKGRPQDNPLIVHIWHMDMLPGVISAMPGTARLLADAFWPGPLTMVLPKNRRLPPEVTAGLDSVGVRMPSHPSALAIIKAAGCPVVAPSANLSGRPSPTTAAHCLEDLRGRVAAVADGGACPVGVESTVLSLLEEEPVVLRPGAVTPAEISTALGGAKVRLADAVLARLAESEKPLSPGMKYRHYAPRARMVLLRGELGRFVDYVNRNADTGVFALIFEGEERGLTVPWVSYGARGDSASQARALFGALRRLDDVDARLVYARCPKLGEGEELAVYNRMLRAAAFEVMEL
jgi:L-threonylcarbamoyladenylate synthase